MKKYLATWLSLLGFVCSQALPASAQSASPQLPELSIWKNVDPKILERLASVVPDSQDGAVGNNRGAYIQVGLQSQSSWIVPKALVEKNPAEVARALRIIAFGFAHATPQGGFEFATASSGSAATELSRAGSAAFFLADVGESLTLLKESGWYTSSPDTAEDRVLVERLMPAYRRAIDWLVTRANVLRTDQAAINRTFIYSNAFGFGGSLLADEEAASQSRSFVDDAIARQLPDGTFPEAGGFDSSYQGVSVFESQIRYANLEAGANGTRLWRAISEAVSRERAAISGRGEVSTSGNTRISANGERLFGVNKAIDGRAIALGLLFFGIVSGASDVEAQGVAVAHQYHVVAP